MNYKALISTIFIFGLFVLSAQAQRKPKVHKIEEAYGMAIGDAISSVKQAAINKAKTNALQKAGIAEDINSYTDYFRSETEDRVDELFSSDILSNIRGTVRNVQVIGEPKLTPIAGEQIKCELRISCDVLEYRSASDPEFNIKVDGVKRMYVVGEELTFSVLPTKSCYLKSFMFFNNEAFVLLPNALEPSFELMPKQEQIYPIDAVYTLDASEKQSETNRIIFVALKKDIPYYEEVSYQKIIDWIFSIPPEERVIRSFTFEVVDQ